MYHTFVFEKSQETVELSLATRKQSLAENDSQWRTNPRFPFFADAEKFLQNITILQFAGIKHYAMHYKVYLEYDFLHYYLCII